MTNARYRRLTQEWLGLQRARAITLASLRSLNEQLEDIRPVRDPPLAEFTRMPRNWIDRYLDEALAEEIVTEES